MLVYVIYIMKSIVGLLIWANIDHTEAKIQSNFFLESNQCDTYSFPVGWAVCQSSTQHSYLTPNTGTKSITCLVTLEIFLHVCSPNSL